MGGALGCSAEHSFVRFGGVVIWQVSGLKRVGKTVWVAWKLYPSTSKAYFCAEMSITLMQGKGRAMSASDASDKPSAEGGIHRQIEGLFEVVLDMLCILDEKGHIKKVNRTWREVLGYTESELKALPLLDLVHLEDRDQALQELDKLQLAGTTVRFENRFQAQDGSYRLVSWSLFRDGREQMIYAAARDITESRRREFELRQVMDAIDRSAIVALTDRHGHIIEANDNFCAISGYSRGELLGQNHRILSSGLHDRAFFRQLWQTIASGRPWSGEIVNRAKNGSLYSVQSVISPLIGLSGKVERYLAIRFDMTQLRESERLLSEAQRVAIIGSWSYNTLSEKLIWSAQMFEIFAVDSAEGAPSFAKLGDSIHPEDRERWQAEIAEVQSIKEPFKRRFRLLAPAAAESKWIELLGEPRRDKRGQVVELRGTCQDVTELVHAEESIKIERAKAAHSAKLASLGEMSAGIAHEINNPLSIIMGSVRALRKDFSQPEKLLKKLEAIEKATLRIAKIVGGLRKFSRTSDKKAVKVFALRRIIDEAILMTGAKQRRHTVAIEFDCRAEAFVLCDELEIEQVMINLINNAIDAVKAERERWVKIVVFVEADEVCLQIRDSGPGIAPEHREKLFQPFFTTKPVGESTGLGLAIVKGILDEHKAKIQYIPQDPYTCFELRFPRADESVHAA